jgi:hypothetical protein
VPDEPFLPVNHHRNPIAAAIARARSYEVGVVMRTNADGTTSLAPAIRHRADGRVEVRGEFSAGSVPVEAGA